MYHFGLSLWDSGSKHHSLSFSKKLFRCFAALSSRQTEFSVHQFVLLFLVYDWVSFIHSFHFHFRKFGFIFNLLRLRCIFASHNYRFSERLRGSGSRLSVALSHIYSFSANPTQYNQHSQNEHKYNYCPYIPTMHNNSCSRRGLLLLDWLINWWFFSPTTL